MNQRYIIVIYFSIYIALIILEGQGKSISPEVFFLRTLFLMKVKMGIAL